jgi:predicted transcriptional regulator
MSKIPISLKLDSDLLIRLDNEANVRGQSRTTFIERAVEEALKTHWTAVMRNEDGSTSPLAATRTLQ